MALIIDGVAEARGDAGAMSSTDGATSVPEPARTPRSFVGYAPRGHALASSPEAGAVSSGGPASMTFDSALYPSLQPLPVDEPIGEPDEQPSSGVLYRPSGYAKPGEAAARGPEEIIYLPANYPSLAPSTVAARAPPLYTPTGHAVPPRAADGVGPPQTEGGEGEPHGVAQVEVSILPSGRSAAEPARRKVRGASATASALRRSAGKAMGRACSAITRACRPTLKQSTNRGMNG